MIDVKNFAMIIPEKNIKRKKQESKTYNTIDELMVDAEYKYNWCEGGRCACIGCVNSLVLQHGFTKEQWQKWVENNPDTTAKEIGYGFETHTYKIKP